MQVCTYVYVVVWFTVGPEEVVHVDITCAIISILAHATLFNPLSHAKKELTITDDFFLIEINILGRSSGTFTITQSLSSRDSFTHRSTPLGADADRAINGATVRALSPPSLLKAVSPLFSRMYIIHITQCIYCYNCNSLFPEQCSPWVSNSCFRGHQD